METVIGIGCTLLGAILGYLAFMRAAKKTAQDEGNQKGVVLTELGYIKSGIDDIKAEQKEQRKHNEEFAEKLGRVDESVKSAHKRLDRLERLEGPEGK